MAFGEVLKGALLAAILWCCSVAGLSNAQRAPCYECELFKQQHPDSKPYEEIRSHCTYPCECPNPNPVCQDGVHLIIDGCGCCQVCARQNGDICDGTHLCDEDKGLVCDYSSAMSPSGTCRAIKGASCQVNQNTTYADGESFKLDCRTQCTCQNGTYGCVSLCAQESIRPSAGGCSNPRLVDIPGRCCREWMCDSRVIVPAEQSEDTVDSCDRFSTDWSPCSTTCGMGVSLRLSNDNEACQTVNETRLCQLRPCQTTQENVNYNEIHHHIRKTHLCRATLHPQKATKLTYNNCTSFRKYSLKWCGSCGSRTCCVPQYTTTLHAQFQCPYDTSAALEPQKGIPETPSLVTYPVMSILKCVCPSDCMEEAKRDYEERLKVATYHDDDDQEKDVQHSAPTNTWKRHRSHRMRTFATVLTP